MLEIQVLITGLFIFDPLVSLVYFAATFFLFGVTADLAGQLVGEIEKDLAYLAVLDTVVSWVIHGLFIRAVMREQATLRISRRDELSGAKNRHCLRYDFDAFKNADLFVMLCDVDSFKLYNDRFGHAVGDEVIKQFYYALREAFGDECVYRYGGDEFLVVSPDFNPGQFERKVKKVSDQLEEIEIEGRSAELTYSGGYIRGTAASSSSFREMLRRADENLLEAKRAGKDQIIGS